MADKTTNAFDQADNTGFGGAGRTYDQDVPKDVLKATDAAPVTPDAPALAALAPAAENEGNS